jgi:ATP-dependent DNA helicase RecG
MPQPPLSDLVATLRSQGGDTANIEVKAAVGGLPQTVGESICGLANLPGGGWLILGLDEAAGFVPVALGDTQVLKQRLANKARACRPPVQLEITEELFEDSLVIVARVTEVDASSKPCKFGGRGWIRSWDGDYEMSELEEQAFLRLRDAPHQDRQPIQEASLADLDPQLIELWRSTARTLDASGVGRFSDDPMLIHGGVMTEDGHPTLAGLLTLGVHPQQFVPRYVVNAAVISPEGVISEPMTVSGPIPSLLESTLAWARKVFHRSVVTGADGQLRDRWQYPLDAVRELVANALVHRNLDDWSANRAVEVRLRPDRFVVNNPGGLYGITIDRLGRPGVSSPRNGRLVEVCRFARTVDDARVVEVLASGIPRVATALSAAGLPPPRFTDTGIEFTVQLINSPADQSDASLSPSQLAAFRALVGGPLSAAEVATSASLKPPTARRALQDLVKAGLVVQHGGQGQKTTYERTPTVK